MVPTSPDVHADAVILDPGSTTKIKPLTKGTFPLEIRLKILDHLTDTKVSSAFRLMTVNREWYATVKGDQSGWKRRAEQLDGEVQHPCKAVEDMDKDFFAAWVRVYREHCVLCKQPLCKEDEIGVTQHFTEEPSETSSCQPCFYEFFEWDKGLFQPAETNKYNLHPSEVKDTSHYIDQGRRFYPPSILRALQKKKLERRFGEISALLVRLSPEDQNTYVKLVEEVCSPRRKLVKHLTATYQASLSSLECPTTAEVLSLVSLYNKWLSVPKALEDYLSSNPSKLKTSKLTSALDWLCSENGEQDREAMQTWREVLAFGRKTFKAFVKEIKSPVVSHASWDCRCGRTPALSCPKRSCARCCTGCGRHDKDEDRYFDRSRDRYYYDYY